MKTTAVGNVRSIPKVKNGTHKPSWRPVLRRGRISRTLWTLPIQSQMKQIHYTR